MQEIKKLLFTYYRKTIDLAQLEKLMKPYIDTYESFTKMILSLEAEEGLEMVKSKGRTSRTPSLALQYRINKSYLVKGHHLELQGFRNILHPELEIDWYYRNDPTLWQEDLPYIQKVDAYIKKYAFPREQVPAPERSYELVGDEKWIVEKGGKEFLERIGLFHKLKIIPVSEPLMLAINPTNINNLTQTHLIVENKTTYQGLLPALLDTQFSTLIYGCGKAVIKSIDQFSMQFPVKADHHFFYFGDIDREGMLIWHSLNKRQRSRLAMPFYRACLDKEAVEGKEYQRENIAAQEEFLSFFLPTEQEEISKLLADGKYYPQETLKTQELQMIWRAFNWKTWI